MNQPTPAIVAQSAVRRLPRWALLLFCIAYVVPGFVGREPWKNADITAFGYMFELATGHASWLSPTLLGEPPEFDALLPYWLGAWAMQLAPAWIQPDFAARIPFVALLALTLLATWYGVYYLARSPRAQPLAFAFGGEASPTDYARAIADGGLLALIASLGLAQLGHETTPALAQLGFTALAFYALAALPYRPLVASLCLAAGLAGLALSGAASTALLFALGGTVLTLMDPPADATDPRGKMRWAAVILLAAALVAALSWWLDLWRWRLTDARDLRAVGRLLIWFTWPTWPLALWTLWRWRRQLLSRHVALPLWFAGVSLVTTMLTPSSDRSLLLGLPALATLAAFALPTLQRSVSGLIDWFTLLFFSGCGIFIWLVWIAMQTGVPARQVSNVAKLAPGFKPGFSVLVLLIALAATLAWAWLVKWRAGRNQAAIWKSLVLPAGGAALCWLLMMTLWMPLVDYTRSYAPAVRNLNTAIDAPGCIEIFGLNRSQVASLRYHGPYELHTAGVKASCPWLLISTDVKDAASVAMNMKKWAFVATIVRPADAKDNLLLYKAR